MNTLGDDAVNKIASGQVITGVVDAIKELIENALDADAKTIKIKLEDQGLKSITVTDDGYGITKDGRETCAKAYTTSKIVLFEDLANELTTFGFRGEAIHSLCVVGDVIITTRCRDEDIAIQMKFDHDGNIKQKSEAAAPFGTSVTVNNLLSIFPVRVMEERTNFSTEVLKNLLSRYFLAMPSIRFVIEAPPYMRTVRPPLSTLMQAIAYEFGTQITNLLIERTVEGNSLNDEIKIKIRGIVPSMNCDWKAVSTSRMQPKQFLFVNGRPSKNSDIEKRINEAYWRKFGSIPKRLPRFFISIDFFKDTKMCSSLFDVNKDPSKSHIFFSEPMTMFKLIDEMLSFLNDQTRIDFNFNIADWPSTVLMFNPKPLETSTIRNLSELGSCTWKDLGSLNDSLTLFQVENFNGNIFLVAMNSKIVLDVSNVSCIEIGRTDFSGLIQNHWDQIYEINMKKQCIFLIGQLR